jgi:hypothetical protein
MTALIFPSGRPEARRPRPVLRKKRSSAAARLPLGHFAEFLGRVSWQRGREKADSHEWHEDSRKSFRGNRITCQHIDASVMS